MVHQGADGVGSFNGIIGSTERAKKLAPTQTDANDFEIFFTLGSLTTMHGRKWYYALERPVQDLEDAQWRDPRIFSPDSQLATVTPGALVRNPTTQELTRIEFLVPTDILKRSEKQTAISLNRKGPFPPFTFVKVEKVEMHLK